MDLADERTARQLQQLKRSAPVLAVSRSIAAVLVAALTAASGFSVVLPQRALAVEPYFCIELVLSRNWPAAQFYCDAASTPGNMGIVLAEGIAHFFGAQNTADVAHAARLWRDVPPIANESEWRNISGVFDPEIDIIARQAANLDRVAQYKLGVLHETGHFETPDKAAALFRYEQAARANLPEAHIALARIYQEGVESIGLEADPVKAEQHLMTAIDLRTPSQRQVPVEAPQEAPADAIADADAGSSVTVEPAGISESDKTAAAVDALGPADDVVPEVVPEMETDVASIQDNPPVADNVAVAPGVDATSPGSTSTGTLPSDRRVASDIDLAPEVLAALLAAAESLDDAQTEMSSSAGSSAPAQSTDATSPAEPTATTAILTGEPEVAEVPTEEGASNVRVITIVPSEPVSSRPVPGAASDLPLTADGAAIEGVADLETVDPVVAAPPDLASEQESEIAESEVELALNVESAPVVEPDAVVQSVPTLPILPSGTGGVRGAPETRPAVLSTEEAATLSEAAPPADELPVAETEPDVETEAVVVNLETLDTGTAGSSSQLPGEGEGRWSPPADVAELYYPREPLDEAPAVPDDVEIVNPETESASTSAGSTSAGSSRLVTTEPFDRSAVSCADNVTGATLAMPVVPDEQDAADANSPTAATQVTDTAALAKIEEGIRAKSAGNVEGALAAWRPLALDGNPTAQYLVGLLFVTGDAAPRNLREAYAWLSLAATQRHQLATCELIRLEQRMSAEDIALARQQAIDLAGGP